MPRAEASRPQVVSGQVAKMASTMQVLNEAVVACSAAAAGVAREPPSAPPEEGVALQGLVLVLGVTAS